MTTSADGIYQIYFSSWVLYIFIILFFCFNKQWMITITILFLLNVSTTSTANNTQNEKRENIDRFFIYQISGRENENKLSGFIVESIIILDKFDLMMMLFIPNFYFFCGPKTEKKNFTLKLLICLGFLFVYCSHSVAKKEMNAKKNTKITDEIVLIKERMLKTMFIFSPEYIYLFFFLFILTVLLGFLFKSQYRRTQIHWIFTKMKIDSLFNVPKKIERKKKRIERFISPHFMVFESTWP